MLDIQTDVSLRQKTTLKIGGIARFYAELHSQEDCEQAAQFAKEHSVPLIALGGGSNTIFADGTIDALIVRVAATGVQIADNTVTVHAGKNLPQLINELAQQNLDLSPLTGILGTVGGAIYGNAGQGFGGIWIDTYVHSVNVLVDGEWNTFNKKELAFGYRTSALKNMKHVLIWSTTLSVPTKSAKAIQQEIAQLLKQRIETQPHIKTAGSCFLSVSKGQPAWKMIDAAGLRGTQVGGIKISEKHANFLINAGNASFADATALVEQVRSAIKEPLSVEMRFVGQDGTLKF